MGISTTLVPIEPRHGNGVTRHGLEHEPGLKLKAVISDDMNLTVPQMLELAELLPPPWISDVEAAGGTNAKPAFPPLGDSPERVPG